MSAFEVLEQFGVPISMCIAFGLFIYKQNQWIQNDLKKDMEDQAKRIENIVVGLINAQKKTTNRLWKRTRQVRGKLQKFNNNNTKTEWKWVKKKMNKDLRNYRDSVMTHLEYIKEKVDANHKHLISVNGRLRKAENNITAMKTVGITLYAVLGAILTWLGLK